MFKSVRRYNFFKGLTNDGIIFSSGNSNWIQIFRKCSGLVKKTNEAREDEDDLTFTAFLHQRQQEARRSILIEISNSELWNSILRSCSSSGCIKKMYQYNDRDVPFVLIEMTSEEKLSDFLKEHHGLKSGFEFTNPFLKLKSCGKVASPKRSFNFDLIAPVNETKSRNYSEVQENLTESLIKTCTDLSLNDLGVRLRFLMCRQMECFCAGFLQNNIAYPFGSSITGFGVNSCDLDIAMIPLPGDSSYFYEENFFGMHRLTIQEHITVLAELMKIFLVGCSGLTLIRNARVPIVKYKNSFTNVECDLSLYNLHGVSMSQLLYTMSLIDRRVRPLIISLKLWANSVGLVHKSPSKTVSNFALSLLAIFFLQQNDILPPWNCFPLTDGFLFDEKDLHISLHEFRNKAKKDKRSLGDLYASFFKFYSTFEFKKNGICIKTAKVIKNPTKYPLYVENPLLKGVNVTRNVDHEEVQKMLRIFRTFSTRFQNYESIFSAENIG